MVGMVCNGALSTVYLILGGLEPVGGGWEEGPDLAAEWFWDKVDVFRSTHRGAELVIVQTRAEVA
jgi:hypothetical protein